MTGPEAVIDRIGVARILPVLRYPDADQAVAAAASCFALGLDVVELTATTSGWPAALESLRRSNPDRLIGVGTILGPADARRALDGGADFLVSPCPVPEVRSAIPVGALLVEGGMTVGEVVRAARHGVAKLFPASVGGLGLLRAILTVAPGIRVIPTGGITMDTAGSWLRAGALAVGVGSDLVRREDPAQAIRDALSDGVTEGGQNPAG
jgi:2-dehydro-3-deoxyphosphogluconate aldolase/(4S)-4-hydroxy-2-oxoglutarate aldolase